MFCAQVGQVFEVGMLKNLENIAALPPAHCLEIFVEQASLSSGIQA